MIYPESIESKIGFDQIKQSIADICKLGYSKEMASKLTFKSSHEEILRDLNPVSEYMSLIEREVTVPQVFDFDPSGLLDGLSVQGNFLEGDQLIRLAKVIRHFEAWNTFLQKERESCPHLCSRISESSIGLEVPKRIESKIEDAGGIKDGASDALRKIRRSLQSASSSARNSLSRIFREAEKKGYVPDGLNISIRDGRLVIPVLAEHKRHLRGFIHDESTSGQTVFIEPADVLEQNNKVRELQLDERKEEVRILIELTDWLRNFGPKLKQTSTAINWLDLVRAKATFGATIDATIPVFKDRLMLRNARHPLLIKSLQEAGRKVVPLSLELSSDNRILLISGPNAGGKSVCLKTVGLLQFMAQSAIPVPVESGSCFKVYRSIFIDMGDEQSLENDLSTYSSHLTNLKTMLLHADKASLILIDEFGTGTEPQFGGALAQSVLEQLLSNRVHGVITTHYSNLKEFAEQSEGIQNGSMRYDTNLLRPLYLLDVGKPGNSFALEIAGNIGLPAAVIEKAKQIAGTDHVSLEQLISKLAADRQDLERRLEAVEGKEMELELLTSEYSALKNKLEAQKAKVVGAAQAQAEQLLREANKEIEKTIRHIRENQAHKLETKKARKRLMEVQKKVGKKKLKPEVVSESPKKIEGPIGVGDIVSSQDGLLKGEVVSVKNETATISIGSLKTNKPLKELVKVGKVSRKKATKSSRNIDLIEKKAHFSTDLDIRGRRAEAAIQEVDKFVDNALLFGSKEVRILHGKGDGILREVVRTHLREAPFINKITDAPIEMGGSGISVITLK